MRDYRRNRIKKEKCEYCNSKANLEYHHMTYNETNNIIKVLCRSCHRKEHRIKMEIKVTK